MIKLFSFKTFAAIRLIPGQEDNELTFGRLRSLSPSVFASFFPNTEERGKLAKFAKAVDSLILNDPAVTSSPTTSPAFGSGLRLGFLGQLHLEVFSQRLLDEFDTDVISTSPTVKVKGFVIIKFKFKCTGGFV